MAGRPAIFETAEDLQKEVDDYLETVPIEKWTITGIALHLGFESRQSFYDYEQKDEFSYIIKRARLNIELAYEHKLSLNSCTGAIFALKNMGWRDKTEQDLNVKGGLQINWKEEKTYETKVSL